jgi:hypothetical protein
MSKSQPQRKCVTIGDIRAHLTIAREQAFLLPNNDGNSSYRGLYLDGDVQSKELPMRSEISVVSTVRLYFQPPVAKDYWSAGKKSITLQTQ